MGSWILVDINSLPLSQIAASQHYYFHIFAYVYKGVSTKIYKENKESKINHSGFHLFSTCNSFLIVFVLLLLLLTLDFKVGFFLKTMSSIPIIYSSPQVFRCVSKNPPLHTMFPDSKRQ